jgi:hypothetical protein
MAPANRHRVAMSWVLLAVQVAVSTLHVFPPLVYRPNPRTARVVEFVNSLGPWWAVSFGLSSVALLVVLMWRHYRHWGHLACVFVWIWFTVALWFGAIASDPMGPILFACVATGLVGVHVVVATAYADDPLERPHRASG